MKKPEIRLDGTVTVSTATGITFVPSSTRDAVTGAAVTNVVLTGTGLSGVAVGDRLMLRLTTR